MSLEKLIEAPDPTHGIAIGHANWRLILQALLAEDGDALYDVAVYDTDVYSDLDWVDMTSYVRGLTWQRGSSEFGGRPETGVLTAVVDTRDGRWSPLGDEAWASYLGPGTLTRLALVESSTLEWVPQIAGAVESWPESFDRGDRTATVTAVETMSILAQMDGIAVAAVGTGDDTRQRVNRLLVNGDWSYGCSFEGGLPQFTMLPTTMAGNRLGELHLTADSGDAVFYNHRSGIGLLRPADARLSSNEVEPIALIIRGPWDERPGVADYGQIHFHPTESGEPRGIDPFISSNSDDYVTVPDAANLDIAGDMTVIWSLDYAGGGFTIAKGAEGSGTLAFRIEAEPGIPGWWRVTQSENGTATTTVVLHGDYWKGRRLFAITVDADNGAGGYTCRLYQAYADGGYWELLDTQSSTAVGTLSRFASSAILEIGKDSGSSDDRSRLDTFEVRNGIGTAGVPGGTLVLGIYPQDISAASSVTSSFTATTGQTVSLVNSPLTSTGAYIVYTYQEFIVNNDRESLINEAKLARAGGTEQTAQDTFSFGRYRFRSTYARSDLLTQTDAQVAQLANRIVQRRSRVSKRPAQIDVIANPGAANGSNLPALFKVDIGDPCWVTLPDKTTRQPAAIAAYVHTVEPGRNVLWRTSFHLDVFPERPFV